MAFDPSVVCAFCQFDLNDGSERQTLPCAHSMHSACLKTYGEVKGQHFADLPCAYCGVVPSAILAESDPEAVVPCTSEEEGSEEDSEEDSDSPDVLESVPGSPQPADGQLT